MRSKRIMIATILGFVCGIICLLLGHFVGKAPWTPLFIGDKALVVPAGRTIVLQAGKRKFARVKVT